MEEEQQGSDRGNADREIGEHERFVVLEDFATDCMGREEKESASDMSHDRPEPWIGDVTQEQCAENAAEQSCGFNRRNKRNSFGPGETGSQEQGAQSEAFRDFVDADGKDERVIECAASRSMGGMGLVAGSERQPVGRAMNGESDHHGSGYLAEMMASCLVEVAGGAGGANVCDIFGDNQKEQVA
jgi:hypothetical protein